MSDYAHMKRQPMSDLNANTEEYPYGLRLDLSDAELEKLGLDDLQVGDTVHLMAFAKVCSTHEHADGEGSSAHCCLQVTHMKAEVEDDEDEEEPDDRTPAERIYGKKK
jgi:hypothetical protein